MKKLKIKRTYWPLIAIIESPAVTSFDKWIYDKVMDEKRVKNFLEKTRDEILKRKIYLNLVQNSS